ncbi:hypothetical protein JTE90_012635 [Oedothorax gibbosus]|uniref:Uncharacterized protein n=1 Tax=Oedothorax gibbosus TaxID=931172 RepID=A0AAV6UMS0_9ARAC|nr:hypothetical protein JTE90_012635 [Oedothorax gibbosus]
MDPMANQVYVDQRLSTLIDTKSISSWGEVVKSLRSYITKKNLFDPNKMKVVCNDELESLLGVSEFAILDIRGTLLKKLVCPIPQRSSQASVIETIGSSSSNSPFYMKRKSEDCIEDEIQLKKKSNNNSDSVETTSIYKENMSHKVSPPMLLQIPSSPKVEFESNCESNLADSVETSFCKDSTEDISDDRPHSTVTHTFVTLETFNVEFEPLSSSDVECDGSSESELDLSLISELSSIVTFVANLESDLEEYLADLSSEDSSSDTALSAFEVDAEIGLLDNWQCSTCFSKNSPINRYCSKCFCTRNGWCNVEKKCGIEKKKRKRRKPRHKRKRELTKEPIHDAKLNEMPCSSNDSSISKNTAENLCLLCCANPVNSSIIHGNFAHSITCFSCASKLKARESRCPICRRHIEKVVYQI